MSNGLEQVINYMIPAVGTPRGYFWSGVLTGAPVTIDFRNVSGGGIDGQVFRPSGVFIDNTQGAGNLSVTINEIAYQMICLPGELLNLQFPAPIDVTVSFVGNGQATLAFVDFPVLPYRNLASGGMVNPMTTIGDIIFAQVAGTPERLAIGSTGQVLTVAGGLPSWATPTAYMSNPMTNSQDLIIGGASGAPARLGVGSNGQVLSVSGGLAAWVTPTTYMTNPMTNSQDLIVGGTSGAPTRVASGTNGFVLTMVAGSVAWAAASGGMSNPLTATGDVIYSGSGSTPARLGIGSAGQVLTVAGGVPSWATPGSFTQTGLPTYLASGDTFPMYAGSGGFVNNTANSITRCHLHLVKVESAITFTKISIGVRTAAASTSMDIGIYNFLGAGKPGTCVASANIPTTATGKIDVTLGSPATLSPGLYYVVMHANSTSPTIVTQNALTNEALGELCTLSVSDAFAQASAGTTTLHCVLVNDSALPGGAYSIGMNLTGLNMTSANIVGYNTFLPCAVLTKQ